MVVGWSVCVFVGHRCESCKNGGTDRRAVSDVDSSWGRKNHVLGGGQIPHEKKHFRGSHLGVSSTLCDTRCYFNVRSEADMSQIDLQHGTKN